MELIDYQYDTGVALGQAFVHQYSGQADRFDLSARAESLLFNQSTDSSAEGSPTYLRWSGKTGSGLGGFESDVRTDVGLPRYAIKREHVNEQVVSEVQGVGIPTAGTYATRLSWQESCTSILSSNQLSNLPGSDLLQGGFSNPLNQDLLDAVIYYESWAYPLKERIRPGETVTLSIANAPRDLARQLQQRRLVDDREQSVPWDRTERRNAPRLLELLSMYEACGGKRYVGLDLRYLTDLDLSDRLGLNRAILLARVEKPLIKWKASTQEQTEVAVDGYRTTVVRFIMPVIDR